MEKGKFIEYLSLHPDFEWAEGECTEGKNKGKDGVFVLNKAFNTETHFTDEAIRMYKLERLLALTSQGKDVTHLTRVVGYFSKTESWNKGKVGELRERVRTAL